MKKVKNSEIEFLRFFMILGVAILHFSEDYFDIRGIIQGGHLGVDFFFLISGFFLSKHFDTDSNDKLSPFIKSIKYIIHRIKALLPHFILSLFFINILMFIYKKWNIIDLIKHLYDVKWQYIFLNYVGAKVSYDERSLWFLSTLVVMSYLVYVFLCINKEVFIAIAPILIILINVVFFNTEGHLGVQAHWYSFISGGNLRAFAEISLGVVAYDLTKYLHVSNIRFKTVFLNIIRVLAYLLSFLIVVVLGFSKEDFFILPCFFIIVVLSEISPLSILTSNSRVYNIGCFLGRISYPIYTYHLVISKFLCEFGNKDYRYRSMLLIYISYTIIFAIFMDIIVVRLKRKYYNEKK